MKEERRDQMFLQTLILYDNLRRGSSQYTHLGADHDTYHMAHIFRLSRANVLRENDTHMRFTAFSVL